MDFPQIIFIIACMLLAAVPPFFIYNKIYEDGVFGRAGLGAICCIAWLILLVVSFGDRYRYSWMPIEIALMMCAFAVFLIWHLTRFHIRVVRRERAAAQSPRMHPG